MAEGENASGFEGLVPTFVATMKEKAFPDGRLLRGVDDRVRTGDPQNHNLML